MFEVSNKNIPNAKNEKLNYLSKMKELIKLLLAKALHFNKMAPRFKNGHLDNPEPQAEVESPIIGSCFDTKNIFFQKGHFLTKRLITFYLSNIVPIRRYCKGLFRTQSNIADGTFPENS